MKPRVALFALATLAPVPLLTAGALAGGGWAVAALIYMTVFAFLMDQLVSVALGAEEDGREFPAADSLSAFLALLHFPLFFLGVAAVAGATGLGPAGRIAAFVAFGLFFGQVSNSNAHELIHRGRRGLFELGKWVFISHLFGHHTSAHRLVHHVHVATPSDPNTARRGESFYHFAPRAWRGSFREGLRAETARPGPNPYATYIGGALALLVVSALLAGWAGVLAHLLLAGYATMQLLLSDYVQHYGLMRATGKDGTPEPVSPAHSWNSAQWFTSMLMLNAPRHSDHHVHPARPYPALQLPRDAPVLPYGLPFMGAIALWPRRWRKVMDRRLPACRQGFSPGTGAHPHNLRDSAS